MNWLSFHKENLIAIGIGLALISVGVGLLLAGWVVSFGTLPLPILGVGVIIFALYRIIRGQKGD